MARSSSKLLPALSLLFTPAISGCLYEGYPNTYFDAGTEQPSADGGADARVDQPDSGPPVGFCDGVECGSGTCNEEARRCDCDASFVYDAASRTCVEDRCATVSCQGDDFCDPLSGECFLFTSRTRTRAKVLHYDGTGLCLYHKRLEAGRFASLWERSEASQVELTMSELALYLEGSTLVGKIALSPRKIGAMSLAERRTRV